MTIATDRIHNARVFLLICGLVAGVYLLTFRASIQSGDTLRAMDAATSFARHGDWLMDETGFIKPALRVRAEMPLPLSEYDVEERLQIVLSAPLLQLAGALPRLGNIHTLWLFNVIITALSCGLVYLNARRLGYSAGLGALLAVSTGIGTNLFAYSQTFFREPLAMLFISLAFLALLAGRGSQRKRALGWLCGIACLAAATLTKWSALFALPGLMMLALPDAERLDSRTKRNLAAAVFALSLATLLLFMFLDPLPAPIADFFKRFGMGSERAGAALRAYFLSPGASVWGTSPLLLLALAGGAALWRSGRRQLVLAIWLIALGYGLGHALTTGPHWFGGLSFPPRFLTPALPVMMLATAPIADKILRGRGRVWPALWLILLLYGLWIQFSAVSLDWGHYHAMLPAESGGLSEWAPALTQPRYFRWAMLPGRWGDLGLNFVWTRSNLPIWGVSFGFYALVMGASLLLILRAPSRRWRHATAPLLFLVLPLILLNLSAVYDRDPRTRSHNVPLRDALDALEALAKPDDALLLSSFDFGEFALNHLDAASPRAIILERPLAQAASEKQPAAVLSHNPNDWFDVPTVRVLTHLAAKRDRLWLLPESSPFMRWSFRPLERYFALRHYPLRELTFGSGDAAVRLLEISAMHAGPDPMSLYAGEWESDLGFGDAIRLSAFDLPSGLAYQAGDVVELSLLWRAEAQPTRDYTVAVFLAADDAGPVVAQGMDSGPQSGFAPTSAWQPGERIWDNRALRLPDDLPSGNYRIWVALYALDAEGRPRRLPVAGAETAGQSTLGALPATLTLE